MKRYASYAPFLIPLIVAAFIVMSCSKDDSKASKTAEKTHTRTIAVIPKATIHEFWKSIHAGAIAASRETGAQIIWKGPIREDDREEQIQIIETFMGSGTDAIVLAPLDDRALILPVREAAGMGIPTVIIDSALQGDSYISFVATDNYKGGVMAAHHLAKLLDGKGNIILMRYQEGSASNANREEGFRDTILKEYPGIMFLSDNQYVGPTTESAYRGSENLLTRFPEVDAIFAPNEPVTFGCVRALEDAGLGGKILLVGFDASDNLIQAMRRGTIHGLVAQDPFNMGYLGVMTAIRNLDGETVEKRIDTGIVLITPENIDDPKIVELYARDLSEYLE